MRPLNGAILVGGRSERMGRDKAALTLDGESLLERACRIVRPHVRVLAVVGALPSGAEPASADLHLHDVPGVRGPIAGILAALGHDPRADWLVLGCDMPAVEPVAVEWLLECRRKSASAGRFDAVLSQPAGRYHPEPLLAIYAPSAIAALRAAVADGNWAMRAALARMNCAVHVPPAALADCWLNVNTPEQWREFLAAKVMRGEEQGS